eukprot:gnl/MRDRNA2_/MRDRNA2_77038_c0_seq2.p1 gnl/MRDRNA2_/MRDRNA2_77038_c0~~gnl/MRDRNA2_/MRDRNA2_77038_c0_seq2.p1  ORF type:complete len:322 (-),score=56.51 gnl/MRDRNA2_/MRDRNA2_77038_c0_seq2:257-1111(-)
MNVLRDAYGDNLGQTGFQLQGHQVVEVCACQLDLGDCNGACRVYGELLPGGCSKALRRPGLNCDASMGGNNTLLLELGMGIGMVALQIFLQCRHISSVVGVEISRPRFEIALAALQRLVSMHAEDFELEIEDRSSEIRKCILKTIRTSDAAEQRVLEFRCGDFLSEMTVAQTEFQTADAIMLQVVLPGESLELVQKRLQTIKDGCRLFSLSNLRTVWCLPQAHHLHAWRWSDYQSEERCEDVYSTSWAAAEGAVFHTFLQDKLKPINLTPFEEWQIVKMQYQAT